MRRGFNRTSADCVGYRRSPYRTVAKGAAKFVEARDERTLPLRRAPVDVGDGSAPGARAPGHHRRRKELCVMATTKTVRRSIRIRRSPVPRNAAVASGFLGLLV